MAYRRKYYKKYSKKRFRGNKRKYYSKTRATTGATRTTGMFKSPKARQEELKVWRHKSHHFGGSGLHYKPNGVVEPSLFVNQQVYNPYSSNPGEGIQQGYGPYQKIGQKISIKYIHMRINVRNDSIVEGTKGTSDTFRFIVFLDKQCNGSVVTPHQVLSENQDDAGELA